MLAGLTVEALVGWPDAVDRRIGHPVRWFGWLVERAERSEMATVLLAIGFGTSFGFIGIAWGVLAVLPHEKD